MTPAGSRSSIDSSGNIVSARQSHPDFSVSAEPWSHVVRTVWGIGGLGGELGIITYEV